MKLVTMRLPDEVKQKLDQIAKDQQRPLSNLIRFILTGWIEKQEMEKRQADDRANQS